MAVAAGLMDGERIAYRTGVGHGRVRFADAGQVLRIRGTRGAVLRARGGRPLVAPLAASWEEGRIALNIPCAVGTPRPIQYIMTVMNIFALVVFTCPSRQSQ